MRKFEYLVTKANFYDPAYDSDSQLNLYDAGRRGWELVSVTTTKDAGFVGKEYFHFYLKREIP